MLGSRLQSHILLGATSTGVLIVAAAAGERAGAVDRVSLTSAWLFVLSLSVVLLLGPIRSLRTGRPMLHYTFRRDVAIWSALVGLVHLLAGALQSMTTLYLQEFVSRASAALEEPTRQAIFLWSTIAGFVVGALLIVLLALSNNWSMKLIGQRRWKRWHRLSYIVFMLTVVHGFGFQMLESRPWAGYAMIAAMTLTVGFWQVRGMRAVRTATHRRRPSGTG